MTRIAPRLFISALEAQGLTDKAQDELGDVGGKFARAHRRHFQVLANAGPHGHWASFQLAVVDDIRSAEGDFLRMLPGRSPIVRWDRGSSGTIQTLMNLQTTRSIVRCNLHGDDLSDALYTLLWNALGESADLRAWLKAQNPHWYSFVEDKFEETT